MSKHEKAWYKSWFDTPYYHTLYKDRNYQEAQLLIDNLSDYLNLEQDSKVLDLACGKGRHSVYLNSLGYKVTGVDLSNNSIESASKYQSESLDFKVHDMREPMSEKYDAVLNLFTSFGYFNDEQDNQKTLQSIHQSLNDYGLAVIDFLNAEKVIENLVEEETKEVDGITFHIKRKLEDGFIVKEISFFADGKDHHHTEKVRALRLQDFEKMMEDQGLFLLDTFGCYKLRKFHPKDSDRLIMIFK
ncbi:class I SAM-dependent methyltransferase [Myroides sp. LJL116]